MEEVRFSSRLIHPEVQSISREEIAETLSTRTTLPYYTKYEFTTLIGTRAQQLADGAKPLVALVHRQFPGGKSEYWSATELSTFW
jgi:hypothetical protein